MRVPTRPLAAVCRVLLWSVLHREPWRYDEVDKGVHEGSEENLVYMLGQHNEVEPLCEGPDPFAEGRDWRYWEGILHGYGAAAESFELDNWECVYRRELAAAVGDGTSTARTHGAGRTL